MDGPKSSKIQNAAPGALQKFTKKRPRCLKIEFRDAFWTHLSSKAGFERVLGGFWEDLGWILRVADHIIDSYLAPCWDKF